MNNEMKLTASNIRYLVAMKKIEDPQNGIRGVDIAKTLGYKKSSVHNMMDFFVEMGVAKKEPNGTIRLTETGGRLSSQYLASYDAVEKIIKGSFPDARDLEEAVYLKLSLLPEESLKKYC